MADFKITKLDSLEVSDIETRLERYDDKFIDTPIEGDISLGIKMDGKLVAGLDATITTFRILYVSTLFVDEKYRRQGLGKALILEMEARAKKMGVTTIRLDTFEHQGKDFYLAMGYTPAGSYEVSDEGYAEYFFVKRI